MEIWYRKKTGGMGGGRRFALADGYDIFYYESGRMAVGGLSAPVYGRKICEPGIFSWAVASDLWSRERVDFDLSAEAAKKTVSGIFILCGGLEYFISWFLEQLYDGKKWWDYSDYFLNLNGRICMEGLFAFGIGGMFLVYVLEPLLGRLFQRIPKKFLMMACLVLLLLFAADLLYSGGNPNMGHGITQGSAQALHEREKEGGDKLCLLFIYHPFIL